MTTPVSVAPTDSAPLTIEVWSDVVCPWCYIGKRRLESAISQLAAADAHLDVQIRWRSFQLDPLAPHPGEPGHGVTIADNLGRKYGGGAEAGRAMSSQVTRVAAADGLDFHLDDAVVGNTVDAHRLLHLAAAVERDQDSPAAGKGLQGRLKERLLEAYFIQGRDVSEHHVLGEIALDVGLSPSRVDEVLGSAEYERDVQRDQARAQAYGATGVPFTVVDGRYGISGAQPVEVFVQALERAIADRAPQPLVMSASAADSVDATQCGPDGCELP